MAANTVFTGTGAGEIIVTRPIGHLVVNVTTATIEISFDGQDSALIIPVGFHDFPVGITKSITIGGAGQWEILTVQS